jgi:hypothetical protein
MQWFCYLKFNFEIQSKSLHSAGSQHDSSITGAMPSLKDVLCDSLFEMDFGNMESTALFLNDEDKNHLRTLPELERKLF